MSIFLVVMRDLVVKSLEAIKVRIEGDDHSLKSVFRNKEISEFKKTLASDTIKFTQELAEGLSDERLREKVVSRLLEIQKNAHLYCEERGLSFGQFGLEINQLILMVQTLYSKLHDFNMLDMPITPNPFVQLCHYSAQYLSHRVYHSNTMSLNVELSKDKEKLLKLNIDNCKFELDGLDRSNQNYKQHYQVRILQAIDKIKADNEQACQKYRSNIGIPLVNLMFFQAISASFSLGPQLGYIDIFMQRAKESIEKQVLEFEPFVQAAEAYAQYDKQEALVARPQ